MKCGPEPLHRCVQNMLTAAPAPAFSTTPVTGKRRLLQESSSGIQVQTQITSPPDSVNAISAAIRNAIASGTLAQALGEYLVKHLPPSAERCLMNQPACC